jgi:uncharacterized protein (TIGR02246 family)
VRRAVGVIFAAAACAACGPAGDPAADHATVVAAHDAYQAAAVRVDGAAIAAYFAPDGVLFEPGINPIRGPDAIRAFVASFPGVRVDSAAYRVDTLEIFGATALVWGTYYERLHFQGQPVSAQDGHYVMQWRRQPDGRWLIARYYRVPLPAARSDAPAR